MRVAFAGTSEYARVILEKLLDEKFNIVALFTQPDRAVGRKQIITPPPTKALILDKKLNIPIYQPEKIKDEYDNFKSLNADFFIVASFGQIIPKNILDLTIPINLHASILPKYRGASPIQEAILKQDKLVGISAIYMSEKLDAGDILGYSYINYYGENYIELEKKLSILASNLTIKILNNFDKLKRVPQNKANSSHCKKIKKDDGLIDFLNSIELFSKNRAFYKWPNTFTKDGLKIVDIELLNSDSSYKIGEIVKIDKNSVDIGCKNGLIRVHTLQPVSKNIMSGASYIRGLRREVGDTLF